MYKKLPKHIAIFPVMSSDRMLRLLDLFFIKNLDKSEYHVLSNDPVRSGISKKIAKLEPLSVIKG